MLVTLGLPKIHVSELLRTWPVFAGADRQI